MKSIARVLLSFLFFSPLKSKKKIRLIKRYLAFLLVIALGNLIAGCYYYKASTTLAPELEEVYQLDELDRQFIVHHGSEAFYVSELRFSGDSLVLAIDSIYGAAGQDLSPITPEGHKRYRKKKGDARLLNEVHLYISDPLEKDANTWQLDPGSIERIDIYNHSTNHTVVYSVLFGLAMLPVAYLAVTALFLLVMLLTGNSCPFIYTWDGSQYVFAGEIYSGAVYKPLERDDYLPLDQLVAEEGSYLLQISNELEEIQHTDLLELLCFDHEEGQRVLVDKYGKPHIIESPLSPQEARSQAGLNLLPLLEKKDDLIWIGPDPTQQPPLLESVELSFVLPEAQHKACLVIEAKNSYWLDFVYKNFRDMLGSSYESWMNKQEKGDAGKMTDWSLDQHIPLSVYILKDGDWVFEDYINTAGPLAMKEDILELDLKDHEPGELRIKLESGAYFWELGYVGLETRQAEAPAPSVLQLSEARDEKDKDVREALLEDDGIYYDQPEIGNLAHLRFPAPEQQGARSLVLHSQGYYEILSDAKGLPKIKALQEIRKAGNFNVYSNELMQIMLREHLSTHGEHSKE